jgi:hypothetical protein
MRMKAAIAFAAAALLVAACSPDPVDPQVEKGEDRTSAPASARAPVAAADPRAAPLPDGLAWTWRPETNSALFGPSPARPQISITCREGMIHITRHAPVENAEGTLSFTGNRSAASVPVAAQRSQLGPGSLSTVSLRPGDMTNAVARVLAGNGPVNITLGGAPALLAPPSDVPGRAFAACR